MGIKMIVEPGKTVKRKDFFRYPEYSIAIDGYCEGSPGLSPDGLRLNINHHERCYRIATGASCAQALRHVKAKLYEGFSCGGKPHACLYVNDCDQDVQWATYILKHPQHVDRPRLKAMVALADLLDMSAGFYPIKKRWHLVRKLLWVSEPYTEARADGRLTVMGAIDMEKLIEQTHRRIRDTLFGGGKEIEPDTRLEVIEDFGRWQFINEIGRNARLGLAQKGITAFVALVGPFGPIGPSEPVGRYVILRRSGFIRWFPTNKMFKRLNEAEGIASNDPDRWSGGDNGGGSPRKRLSRLTPEQVTAIVKECCDEEARHGALRC
jgi:hypothetical protein